MRHHALRPERPWNVPFGPDLLQIKSLNRQSICNAVIPVDSANENDFGSDRMYQQNMNLRKRTY